MSGHVSRAEITVGNLVQTGPNAPVLTTIVSDQGIYADFEIDEQTYLDNIRSRTDAGAEKTIPVQIVLNGMAYDGAIRSFDNRINVSTGTIRARAFFDNSDNSLIPGMFVTVRMASPHSGNAIILTEQAIGTDQDRKFVYTVDEENKVAYRVVTLGESLGGRRVIASGLEPGDKVITEAIMKVMPGMAVLPQVSAPGDENGIPSPQTTP